MEKTSNKFQTGFTLFEILVVLFIMGLVLTLVVLRGGNTHGFREMDAFAQQLKAQMQLAREQSILQMDTLGLKITAQIYEFYWYNNTPKQTGWQRLSERDSFWKSYTIPANIQVNIANITTPPIVGTNISAANHPQIIFFPSGEISSFIMTIQSSGTPHTFKLIGNANGNFELQEAS